MRSSSACSRCGTRWPVRLGPGEACAACRSQDAWARWEGEGKLVIDHAAVHEAEARRRGDDRRKLLGVMGAWATALAVGGMSALCVYVGLRLFDARPLGSLAELMAHLRAGTLATAGCGLLCLLVSLLALRLPYPRRGRLVLLAARLTGVLIGGGVAVLAGLMGLLARPPHDFAHLSMPPRDKSAALPEPAARVMDATVVILAPDRDGDLRGASLGTGAVVAASEGRALIVTCSHVAIPYIAVGAFRDVAAALDVWVELADGRQAPGRVVWTAAPPLDVALVEVRVDSPPEPVPILRSTEGIEADEAVFFVPNPLRRGFRVDNGKVIRREGHDTPAGHFSLLFTTLPVEQGDSGSGLFDARGRLIGLNTWQRKSRFEHQGISLPAEALAEIARVTQEGSVEGLNGARAPLPQDPPLEASP